MIDTDPIILGDNQFFGVNHRSEDRGRQTGEKFKEIREVQAMLRHAVDCGVKAVFFSTHPSLYAIADMMRKDPVLKKELAIYANVPYIAKYARMLTEMGMYGTVQKVLSGDSWAGKISFFAKSAYNVLTQDYLAITNRLVDAEVSPLKGLQVKSIFLHDSLSDLLLGYGLADVFRNFSEYVRKRYGAAPGFGTFNYPKMAQMLAHEGIRDVIIMTAVNKRGFFMNPSRQAVEQALAKNDYPVLAMSTLAAGSIPPREAYAYLFSLPAPPSVVVGASSKEHMDETFAIISGHRAQRT